ncbi:MAG: S9 family peptidase, partial [Parasphingorhabdus sp.]
MKTRYLLVICSLPSFATAALASDGDDSRRFTAERVFDLEYADDPQISPDGSTIIYARKSMDKFADQVVSDLWMIDTRNGDHRPLVSGQGSSSSVRWSPAGDRIIYLTSNNGKPELRLRYQDSGDSFSLAQLENGPGAPVWSPDGKTVAFSMLVNDERATFAKPPKSPEGADWAKPVGIVDDLVFRFDGAGYLPKGKTQIFTLNAEGGTPRQITHGINGFDSPQWLGNGALLVTGNESEDADLDPIESEIYRLDLAGQTVTPLTQRDGPDFAPNVSPNGARIAYLGYDDRLKSYQQTDVYLMAPDGSNVQNLTVNFDRSVDAISWRPDSRALIGQTEVDGILTLVSIDLSGNVRSLIQDIGGTSLGRPYAAGSFSVAS